MTLVSLKWLGATVIWVLTLISGSLCTYISYHKHHWIKTTNAFANGVLLGAGLFHLLPDAIRNFETQLPHFAFEIALASAFLGFLLLTLIEKAFYQLMPKNPARHKTLMALLVTLVISVHAFITGAALGITNSYADALLILIAILLHKGCESFAVAANLQRAKLGPIWMTTILIVFSTLTPVGILVANWVNHSLQHHAQVLLTAYFNALASGTLVYIGCEHVSRHMPIQSDSYSRWRELVATISGAGIMALVSIWL